MRTAMCWCKSIPIYICKHSFKIDTYICVEKVGLEEKKTLVAMIESNMKHIQSSFSLIKCLCTYRNGISEGKLNHKHIE